MSHYKVQLEYLLGEWEWQVVNVTTGRHMAAGVAWARSAALGAANAAVTALLTASDQGASEAERNAREQSDRACAGRLTAPAEALPDARTSR